MIKDQTAKRWKCFECEEVYISPIPVYEVHHRCKKAMPPKAKRKGMLPQ